MKEFVSHCDLCKKPIYCVAGFYQGVILENGISICLECEEKRRKNEKST